MLYVKNLHKSYQTGRKSYSVLKGIDLSVADREFVAVMGPSGSGKSTLLNCISCYIPFDEGTITLGGKELKGMDENALARVRNEKLGFVFQDFMLLDGLTVRENILVPRIIQEKAESDAEELADKLLALFGIASIADKYPADISGGEKQRTAVARSLINRPLLILADEPTGNLDSKSSRTVIEAFEEARSSLGASVFMVTHDSFAASFCDRVILLKDGMVYDTLEAEPGHREDGRGAFQDRLLCAIREMSRTDSADSGRISAGNSHISADNSHISADSNRISPDNSRISPDSNRISPDSTRISPDSTRIPPDSNRISPHRPSGTDVPGSCLPSAKEKGGI